MKELLRAVSSILDSVGIPYMVVGSFASTAYGEPRSTRDLDLVIDPSPAALDRLLEQLDPSLYYVDADARDALRRRSIFNVIEMASAWKIDLIIRKARRFSIEELSRRQRASILGIDVATATAEDTIIAKLEWSKQGASDRQLEDIAGILRVRTDLDFAYIARWVRELELDAEWQRVRTETLGPS
jgi:hypothetical protein